MLVTMMNHGPDYRLETSCNEYHSEDYDYYTVVNKKQNFRV